MSFQLVKKAIRSEQPTPVHKLVLIVIADHVNEKRGGTAYPSVQTIAEYVGVSPRHVQRVLRDLEAQGVLELSTKRGYMGTNKYRILTHNMTWVSPQHDMGVTPNMTWVSQGGDMGVTRIYKEHINIDRIDGPPPSGQGGAVSAVERTNRVGEVAPERSSGDTPCEKHPYHYDDECETCYANKGTTELKEQTA